MSTSLGLNRYLSYLTSERVTKLSVYNYIELITITKVPCNYLTKALSAPVYKDLEVINKSNILINNRDVLRSTSDFRTRALLPARAPTDTQNPGNALHCN